MLTKFIEASHGGGGNWGKFMLGRFSPEEWTRHSELPEIKTVPGSLDARSLLAGRGWSPKHILFMDLQTGEGAMLLPHRNASVHADLDKHKVWLCPMAEPFLEWLYQQDLGVLDALPAYVELPDAPFAMAGYRRPGKGDEYA